MNKKLMTKHKVEPKKPDLVVRSKSMSNSDKATAIAKAAIAPSINATAVIHAFQDNLFGEERVEMPSLVDALVDEMQQIKSGDLSELEGMLYAQAAALQTMFASLARRAKNQEHLKQYETHMTLALKAQAQSRTTIQALVELKYPRQVAFVKQANIAHGNQQVNNGVPGPNATHASEIETTLQNKLLESPHDQICERLDTRETAKTTRGNSRVAAMEASNRTAKRKR